MKRVDTEGSIPDGTPQSAGPSRRAVLTAGAWSVPVILLASASPAAAVSGPIQGTLQYTNFSVWFDWDSSGHRIGIAGCTTVFLTGDPGATVGPVTLVVSVPEAQMSTATPVIDERPTAWVAQPGAASGGTMKYTFTWSGTLTVPASAYSTQVTFHLPGGSGVNLAPPISWSAIAMAMGAQSAEAQGSLVGLADSTALPAQLSVDAGTLEAQGPDQLVWSGASIVYSGQPQPAVVQYVALLRGPDGGVLALLSTADVDVSTAPIGLGTFDYSSSATTGRLLVPGAYVVTLTVLGQGGTVEKSTSAVTL